MFEQKLNKHFNNMARKSSKGAPLQILVSSKKHGIDFNYSNTTSDQPYHTASIGKMFTAAIIGMLCEKGLLQLDDRIDTHLSAEILHGLFVYNNMDYKEAITIRHLLGHTSGIADYFESNVTAGSKFMSQILNNPEKMWTPAMLVDFTRNTQVAASPPGKFFYSDTGYVLLGLIAEKVTGKSFADIMGEYIFQPLDMKDSYLMFYSEPQRQPKKDIANIWFDGKEISKLNLLSCDWAGGGVVSTTSDLLKFQKAFWDGILVSKNFMVEMQRFDNKYRAGIYYGLGMMELHFEEFFFLLKGLPRCKGHLGILATHMFYDPKNDAHIIMNFGSNKRMVESFKALITIERFFKTLN